MDLHVWTVMCALLLGALVQGQDIRLRRLLDLRRRELLLRRGFPFGGVPPQIAAQLALAGMQIGGVTGLEIPFDGLGSPFAFPTDLPGPFDPSMQFPGTSGGRFDFNPMLVRDLGASGAGDGPFTMGEGNLMTGGFQGGIGNGFPPSNAQEFPSIPEIPRIPAAQQQQPSGGSVDMGGFGGFAQDRGPTGQPSPFPGRPGFQFPMNPAFPGNNIFPSQGSQGVTTRIRGPGFGTFGATEEQNTASSQGFPNGQPMQFQPNFPNGPMPPPGFRFGGMTSFPFGEMTGFPQQRFPTGQQQQQQQLQQQLQSQQQQQQQGQLQRQDMNQQFDQNEASFGQFSRGSMSPAMPFEGSFGSGSRSQDQGQSFPPGFGPEIMTRDQQNQQNDFSLNFQPLPDVPSIPSIPTQNERMGSPGNVMTGQSGSINNFEANNSNNRQATRVSFNERNSNPARAASGNGNEFTLIEVITMGNNQETPRRSGSSTTTVSNSFDRFQGPGLEGFTASRQNTNFPDPSQEVVDLSLEPQPTFRTAASRNDVKSAASGDVTFRMESASRPVTSNMVVNNMNDVNNININSMASVNSMNNVNLQNTNSALKPNNITTISVNVENNMDAVILNNSSPNSGGFLATGSNSGLTSSSEFSSTITSSSAGSSRSREPDVVRMAAFRPPQTDFSFFIASPTAPDVMPPIDVPVTESTISNAGIDPATVDLTSNSGTSSGDVTATRTGTSSGDVTVTRTVVTRTEEKVMTSNTGAATSGSAADVIPGTTSQTKPTP